MIDKYTIDSPYKALYWSFYNIAYSEIYKAPPEFIPTVSFEPSALSKLDGYPYVSTASARKLLDFKRDGCSSSSKLWLSEVVGSLWDHSGTFQSLKHFLCDNWRELYLFET